MTYFKEHVTLSQENIEEFWQVCFRKSSLYPVQKVKMPERCIAARCSNVSNPKKGISMHKIPFLGSTNPTAQRRRKRWVDFVLSKRKDWTPGKTSSLCSLHFREDDFNFRLDSDLKHSLRSDDIGTCVFPTIHAKEESEEPPSKREKRMVSNRRKCVKIYLLPRAFGGFTNGKDSDSFPIYAQGFLFLFIITACKICKVSLENTQRACTINVSFTVEPL